MNENHHELQPGFFCLTNSQKPKEADSSYDDIKHGKANSHVEKVKNNFISLQLFRVASNYYFNYQVI